MTWKLDKAIAEAGWRLAHEWPSVAAAKAWIDQQAAQYRTYGERPAWLAHFSRGLWDHSRRNKLPWTRENPGRVELWKAQPEFETMPGSSRPNPGFLVIRQQGTNRPLHLYRLDYGHRQARGATVDDVAHLMRRHTAEGFEWSRQYEVKQEEQRAEHEAERERIQALYADAEAMLADCGFEDLEFGRDRYSTHDPKVVLRLEDFLALVRTVHQAKVEV